MNYFQSQYSIFIILSYYRIMNLINSIGENTVYLKLEIVHPKRLNSLTQS